MRLRLDDNRNTSQVVQFPHVLAATGSWAIGSHSSGLKAESLRAGVGCMGQEPWHSQSAGGP